MYKLETVGNMVVQFLEVDSKTKLTFLAICRLSQDYGAPHGRKANPAVCSASRKTLALEINGDAGKTKNLDRPLRVLRDLELIEPLVPKPTSGHRQEYRILLAEMLAGNPLMVEALKERWKTRKKNLEYLDEVVARGKEGRDI